jgi:hypothetical protein
MRFFARPRVVQEDLAAAYRKMAANEAREAEAHEWADATILDLEDLEDDTR